MINRFTGETNIELVLSLKKEFPKVPLPQGWVWTTDWRLDRAGGVDQDGWAYSYDFRTLKNWPPASGYEKAATNVRRRRWVRSRQRKESNKNLYLSLGTVEPHSTVACPLESLRSGSLDYIIQVRFDLLMFRRCCIRVVWRIIKIMDCVSNSVTSLTLFAKGALIVDFEYLLWSEDILVPVSNRSVIRTFYECLERCIYI